LAAGARAGGSARGAGGDHEPAEHGASPASLLAAQHRRPHGSRAAPRVSPPCQGAGGGGCSTAATTAATRSW
jgi:hypothetical protein